MGGRRLPAFESTPHIPSPQYAKDTAKHTPNDICSTDTEQKMLCLNMCVTHVSGIPNKAATKNSMRAGAAPRLGSVGGGPARFGAPAND